MPRLVNYAALSEELKTGKGFSSYGAIVEWLKQKHGQNIEYATVYAWVRYRLGAKLKVPRPQSHNQDEKLVSEFKKNAVAYLQVLRQSGRDIVFKIIFKAKNVKMPRENEALNGSF